MGYKRAGFEVLGNVEIYPKINAMYKKNHHPKYNYEMDLRDFNAKEDLPEELFNLDILDGSPPCSTFSMAGDREKAWGKEKQFREGQKMQRLDDLFFVFLDTVEKLKPKVVVAENVVGLIAGNARGYLNEIIKRFKDLGYDVQIFRLNAADMDVPQARERVFVIANRLGFKPLHLAFNYDKILLKTIKEPGKGKPIMASLARMVPFIKATDRDFGDVCKRLKGKQSFFNYIIEKDNEVAKTITSHASSHFKYTEKLCFTDVETIRVQSFPRDYDFNGNPVAYVCGMSVPRKYGSNGSRKELAMGKYGSGISMAEMFKLEKEEIKKTLKGVTPEQLKAVIESYENAVYHALEGNACAKALENIMKKRGIETNLEEFVTEKEKCLSETKYEFENEPDEDF